jgi:hypothetical protein
MTPRSFEALIRDSIARGLTVEQAAHQLALTTPITHERAMEIARHETSRVPWRPELDDAIGAASVATGYSEENIRSELQALGQAMENQRAHLDADALRAAVSESIARPIPARLGPSIPPWARPRRRR